MFDDASAELLWFLVGLVLLLSELALPGFVIVFFGVGAWVTAVLVGFGLLPGFNAQLLVFLITSILALALFRNKGRIQSMGLHTQMTAYEDWVVEVQEQGWPGESVGRVGLMP